MSIAARTSNRLVASVARVAFIVSVFAGALEAQFAFLGVASGDATSTSAIVWTRAVDQAFPAATQILLEVSVADPTFSGSVLSMTLSTDPVRDFTAKGEVTGLVPETRYYYRFSFGGIVSPIGRFKTAPDPSSTTAVRFAFSGDADGRMRPYPIATAFPAREFDFFLFLGDTVYGSSSTGSPAAAATGTQPIPTSAGASATQLATVYARKYREQYQSVNSNGQTSLQPLFAAQGNYTLADNHEFGNRQYAEGGAPAGGPVGGMPTGAGVDARVSINDANMTTSFINQSLGFRTLLDAFVDHQPIKDRGLVSATGDPRSDGTRRLYFAQPWGKNATLIVTDSRSYRDIRMKDLSNFDETSPPRGDNPIRTMLGSTQLSWLKAELLAAQQSGTVWKFVAMSSPIDQCGPIGSGVDGGKTWMGGYRAERNDLLKFIADNRIANVVFMATDDHQVRVNEIFYSPLSLTDDASTYVRVPHCFSIVAGPLGGTGPDFITDHSFLTVETAASLVVAAQLQGNVDPIGLSPFHAGLVRVEREGHATADQTRLPVDFYSPDTFNFAELSVSNDGSMLTVKVSGIDSIAANAFDEHDALDNPMREILEFEVAAFNAPQGFIHGQTNSARATLRVNGQGANRQGPIDVPSPAGSPVSFEWNGPPGQPVLLAWAPLLVPGQTLPFGLPGLLVDLDFGTIQVFYTGLDPALGPDFVTDSSGAAAQTFAVPIEAAGVVINVQGALFAPPGASALPFDFMTTAAFSIQF